MEMFKPFANDEQCWSVGAGEGLSAQNGTETVSIYGEAKFAADAAGKARAGELLAVLKAVSEKLPQGASEKSLWVKKSAASLAIGGDVDLDKGRTGADALAKAIAALESFAKEPAAAKKPKS